MVKERIIGISFLLQCLLLKCHDFSVVQKSYSIQPVVWLPTLVGFRHPVKAWHAVFTSVVSNFKA